MICEHEPEAYSIEVEEDGRLTVEAECVECEIIWQGTIEIVAGPTEDET